MPAIDDLRALLERQRKAIERSEPGVRDGADPEDLHRFRVATRRSRAMIRASRPLVRDQLAALDRELRWLGSATGPVRDLDVLIEHLRELEPSLDPDQAGARGDRRRARARAARAPRRRSSRARHDALPRAAHALRRRRADAARRGRTDVSLEQLAAKELDRVREGYDELGDDPDATRTSTRCGSAPSTPATRPSSRRRPAASAFSDARRRAQPRSRT